MNKILENDARAKSGTKRVRVIVARCAAALGLCASAATAADLEHFKPSSWHFQIGATEDVRSLTGGLSWELPYTHSFAGGVVTSHLDGSVSVWKIQSDRVVDRSKLLHISLIPVFRYRPNAGASPWFADAGVGITLTSSVYKTRNKSFSTAFNFGTVLAVGRSFGARREHEVSLRVEHFSNAGIKQPNPGANFIELRYAHRFF